MSSHVELFSLTLFEKDVKKNLKVEKIYTDEVESPKKKDFLTKELLQQSSKLVWLIASCRLSVVNFLSVS